MKLKYVMLCLLAIGAIAFADNFWNFSSFGVWGSAPVLYPTTFPQNDISSFIISGPNTTSYVPRPLVTMVSNNSNGVLSIKSYASSGFMSPQLLSFIPALGVQSPDVGVFVPLFNYEGNPSPMPRTTSATGFYAYVARQNGTGFLATLTGFVYPPNNNMIGFSVEVPSTNWMPNPPGKIAFRANLSASNSMGLLVTGSGENKVAADLQGAVILRDNAGTGNAYACFDSEGKLFRSAVPCTRAQ